MISWEFYSEIPTEEDMPECFNRLILLYVLAKETVFPENSKIRDIKLGLCKWVFRLKTFDPRRFSFTVSMSLDE